MNQIPQELLNRLDALAAKLGITVTYLWAVLVRQGKLEGIICTVESLIGLGGLVTCAFWIKNIANRWDNWNEHSKNSTKHVCEIVLMIIIIVISTGIFCNNVDGILVLFNPQYWALQQIFQLIGK